MLNKLWNEIVPVERYTFAGIAGMFCVFGILTLPSIIDHLGSAKTSSVDISVVKIAQNLNAGSFEKVSSHNLRYPASKEVSEEYFYVADFSDLPEGATQDHFGRELLGKMVEYRKNEKYTHKPYVACMRDSKGRPIGSFLKVQKQKFSQRDVFKDHFVEIDPDSKGGMHVQGLCSRVVLGGTPD